jgi:hypothetical protein
METSGELAKKKKKRLGFRTRHQWFTPCNPSYLGGRDQEDHSLKPVWTKKSETLSQKIPNTKKD